MDKAIFDKQPKYEVYEDNAGGLYLFILDNKGKAVEAFDKFEHQGKGALASAINEISDYKSWDNCISERIKDNRYGDVKSVEKLYTEICSDTSNMLIADNQGVYADRFGIAGKLAFDNSKLEKADVKEKSQYTSLSDIKELDKQTKAAEQKSAPEKAKQKGQEI